MFKKFKRSDKNNVLKTFYRSISCAATQSGGGDVAQVSAQPIMYTRDIDLFTLEEDEEYLKQGSCFEYNIILDLDGTLVHTLPCSVGPSYGDADFEDHILDFYTFKRPGLDKFLKYCFANFASVSVWTAGTQEYAKYVVENICPEGEQFLYILSRDNCSYHPTKQNTLVKDLHDIWDSYYGKELNLSIDNTLIVDDNDEVCYHNAENAILIPSWSVNIQGSEDSLFKKLIFYFEGHQTENDAWKLCAYVSESL